VRSVLGRKDDLLVEEQAVGLSLDRSSNLGPEPIERLGASRFLGAHREVDHDRSGYSARSAVVRRGGSATRRLYGAASSLRNASLCRYP
jgi:hypothetical protein